MRIQLTVAALCLSAAAANAQVQPAPPRSGFTITPFLSMGMMSSVESVVRINDFGAFDIDFTFEPDALQSFGVNVGKSVNERWSLFGEASLAGGDVDVEACSEGSCDSSSLDRSSWTATAGVTRRFARSPFATGILELALGATVTRVAVEIPDSRDELVATNPGLLAGLILSLPIAPTMDLRLHLTDAVVKLDGSFSDDLRDSFEGSAESVDTETEFLNILTFGVGLRIRF